MGVLQCAFFKMACNSKTVGLTAKCNEIGTQGSETLTTHIWGILDLEMLKVIFSALTVIYLKMARSECKAE